ncbi:hypothetical protein EKJ_13050 [Qipengyuania flava]|uniref:Uncharacterized protein n=1 Tax=Qipengyuania flava TaxID=192812 RepID=A0A3T1CHV2_9SPHN|nr:hypothetical protein [Qipengyuania flava]BBI20458.1 hypothetical protein EKJ_13050 [Qipengyuania flava]
MKLSDAQVGVDGSLIVDGQITFPPDPAGKFEQKITGQLALRRPHLALMTCKAQRGPSGFYEISETGVVLGIPRSFTNLVSRALRGLDSGDHEEIWRGQDCYLHNSEGPSGPDVACCSQPLTNWLLRISETDGYLHVELSADLKANRLREWSSSEGNFWTSDARPRVRAKFTVSPATRVAACRYLVEEEQKRTDALLEDAQRTTRSLNLASSAVSNLEEFGVSGGRWINIGLGSYLAITEHSGIVRRANGLLSYGTYVWPRIWFRGVSIGSLEQASDKPTRITGAGLRTSIEEGGRDGWIRTCENAALEFFLSDAGLVFRYDVRDMGRDLSREVIIPWEVLILRYPEIITPWLTINRAMSDAAAYISDVQQ